MNARKLAEALRFCEINYVVSEDGSGDWLVEPGTIVEAIGQSTVEMVQEDGKKYTIVVTRTDTN